LTVGTVIPQNPPGQLVPGFSFLPGPDRSNNDRQTNTNDYCEISYAARDQTGTVSLTTKTISISVTPVNLPPRIGQGSSAVVAVEQIPTEFVINGVDPEGNPFDTYITNCAVTGNDEQFSVCLDVACAPNNRQNFKCTDVQTAVASNGVGLKLSPRISPATGTYPPGLTAVGPNGYYVYFTSNKLPSGPAGVGYQTLSVQFVPQQGSSAPLFNFAITFNVIQLNQPPVISVNNVSSSTHSTSLNFGEQFLPALSVYDPDVANGDMTVTINFSPQDGSTITFVDKNTGLPITVGTTNSQTGEIDMSGKMITLNSNLAGFKFTPASSTPTTYTIMMTVNDLGNTGQCPHDNSGNQIPLSSLTVSPGNTCPLTDQTSMTVTYVSTTVVRDAAIGASGAAVFVAGIIAAVLAARAFNQKAESSAYKPWDVFHESDAVLSNPLYEEGTVGGSSGIYEGKQKGLLDGSSSESPKYVGMDQQV